MLSNYIFKTQEKEREPGNSKKHEGNTVFGEKEISKQKGVKRQAEKKKRE